MQINFDSAIHFTIEQLSPMQQEIHDLAQTRAKRYLTAEAELLESIIEIDRTRLFEKFGETHLTPYCERYLGLSSDVAAVFVRVARKSRSVPELKDAIDDGRLTVTKAKVIASVVTPENKTEWIDKAATLGKYQLEKEVVQASPLKSKSEKAKPTGPNRNRVEYELTDEQMEMHKRVRDLVSQKLGHSASVAEMEVAMLEFYLKHNDPVEKAKRAKPKPSREQSQDRSPARKPRPTPAPVKHAVNNRDLGKCQARKPDGSTCGETRWLEHHHIVPLAKGGPDTPENIVTLCSTHHRQWHERQRL